MIVNKWFEQLYNQTFTSSYLEAPSQELVLHLQEVAFVGLRLKGLVDDGERRIVLDVLPPSVAVAGAEVKGGCSKDQSKMEI